MVILSSKWSHRSDIDGLLLPSCGNILGMRVMMGIQPGLERYIRVGERVPALDLIFLAYFSSIECVRVVHE